MNTQTAERRARNVALVGLAFELLLVVVFTLLTLWTRSEAMRGLTLLAGLGLPIWVFLSLIYQQRALVQDEAFETELLRQEQRRSGGAIFDVEAEELLLAKRRLQWMYRWVLPAFGLALIGGLVAAERTLYAWGLGLSVWAETWPAVEKASLATWFVGGTAFLSFLLSRYATGMARQPEWRLLRAGASYLMGVTLGAAALTLTFGALHLARTPVPEHFLAYALRILLLLLAGEFALNFVLDIYRPRVEGEEPRPAFDSRLLGLFSEPGGLARSIADAINYQFGFEVSSTWFYKLMQQAVVPLVGFAVVTLFAASCLVFVEAESQIVVERFGEKVVVLEPGLHLKYPWPVDIAYRVDTQRIHELKVGTTTRTKKEKDEKLILWTNRHFSDPHLEVLVATPKLEQYWVPAGSEEVLSVKRMGEGGFATGGEAVPVSMLRVAVTVQYRIKDAYQWLTTYEDPEAMFKAIAERETVRYCASVDVANILGARRGPIERALWEAIEKQAAAQNIGIEVVFLGLQGAHPPDETATAFQDVIGAEQKLLAAVRSAESEERKLLTQAAGYVDRAKALKDAIRKVNRLEAEAASEVDCKAAQQRLDKLFDGDAAEGITRVGGEAAGAIVAARSKRWQMENQAHAEAVIFQEEIASKEAAPQVYYLRRKLQVLAESLPKIRKYVIVAEGKQETRMFQLNLQDPMNAPLDVALEEESP